MNHLFTKKIAVVQVTKTNTALGGTEKIETILVDVPCRIVQPKGIEEVRFGKIVRVVDLNLYCAVETIVQSDRITYDGNTYEILNINAIEHSSGSFLKISLGLAK